jgi:hypothetical protein
MLIDWKTADPLGEHTIGDLAERAAQTGISAPLLAAGQCNLQTYENGRSSSKQYGRKTTPNFDGCLIHHLLLRVTLRTQPRDAAVAIHPFVDFGFAFESGNRNRLALRTFGENIPVALG